MTNAIIVIIAVTVSFLIALCIGSVLYARNKTGPAIACIATIIIAGVVVGVLLADRISSGTNYEGKDRESMMEINIEGS